jgi:hypothetical protein
MYLLQSLITFAVVGTNIWHLIEGMAAAGACWVG